MQDLYPAGPVSVPDDLSRPSGAYQRKAWMAVGGLAAFIVLYLALSGWFIWTAWRLFAGMAQGHGNLGGVLVAAGATFFAAFMLKALFFFQRGQEETADLEVSAADEPALFDFLHRLADEARAPRPHRVFLSARVNAAVFYDLSLVNLLWPSRKNLEIGLGLVNVLSLGELKAVLAHEFGHFGQRSMAVGRWVYMAQQIAGHIIARRDAFDRFLDQLSRIDLRLAWIGWLMQIIVWSIRSLLEIMFRGVVLAQRALAREMELQADLVAVSLAGSDSLVHALHRLHVADEAWSRTLAFGRSEFLKERPVADLFAVQTQIIERMRRILDQPHYGRLPLAPEGDPAAHRLFKTTLAQPPRMWATHPPDAVREENAKRNYVPAPGDVREAWVLFADPAALRRAVSQRLAQGGKAEPAPLHDSLARLDQDFDKLHLDRRYRGAYLGRSPVRHAATPDDLYGPAPDAAALVTELATLYPESLGANLERLRALDEEIAALTALRDGTAQAADGVLQHRGLALTRRQVPKLIAQVEQELRAERAVIESHDARCRAVHLAAAERLGPAWRDHLRGLAALLHYADHAEAGLRDMQGELARVFHLVTAGGKVGERGLKRLLDAADLMQEALAEVYGKQHQVRLDPALAARLGVAEWSAALGPLKLPAPTRANIRDWLNVIDGWVNSAAGSLAKLRVAALELLLSAEAQVADAAKAGAAVGEAPAPPSAAPDAYPVLLPGTERARRRQLHWWDRFRLARGYVPATARLLVALSIVGGVLFFSGGLGKTTVTVYNGLMRPVRVSIGGSSAEVAPSAHADLELAPAQHYAVKAQTREGALIESFQADAPGTFGTYVYNIAGAAPLVQWTAVYGNVAPVPETPLGAPRWRSTDVDLRFAEPPAEIQSKTGGGSRRVLSAVVDRPPSEQLELAGKDPGAGEALVAAHARWDATGSPDIVEWLRLAASGPDFGKLLQARLAEAPNDVLLLRLQRDQAEDEARGKLCDGLRTRARAVPGDADLQYLAAGCIDEAGAREAAFAEGYKRFPDNPWFAQAAAYAAAAQAQWAQAIALLDQARHRLPAMAAYYAVELYRIHRLLGSNTPALTNELSRQSETLRNLLAVESGSKDIVDLPILAYHDLAQGQLERALSRAGSDPQTLARMQRLVAASDGASAAQIALALQLPADQGLDRSSAWAGLGLALREHRDTLPYLKAIQDSGMPPEAAERAVRFVESARPDLGAEAVAAKLAGLEPQLRGLAYAGAAVALGQAAPPAWKQAASRLLFINERPYFR